MVAFLVAAFRLITWVQVDPDLPSPMQTLTSGAIDAASGSVTLAIGLVDVMAVFLGLMKVAEAGGLLVIIAKTMRPLMLRLFPEVPPEHPAMGAMTMNLWANVMGLGNAATPYRYPRDAGTRQTQCAKRHGYQCNGAVPGDKHFERHTLANRCGRAASRSGLKRPGWHCANYIVRDYLFDNHCDHHC
jgi:hypothetical protein